MMRSLDGAEHTELPRARATTLRPQSSGQRAQRRPRNAGGSPSRSLALVSRPTGAELRPRATPVAEEEDARLFAYRASKAPYGSSRRGAMLARETLDWLALPQQAHVWMAAHAAKWSALSKLRSASKDHSSSRSVYRPAVSRWGTPANLFVLLLAVLKPFAVLSMPHGVQTDVRLSTMTAGTRHCDITHDGNSHTSLTDITLAGTVPAGATALFGVYYATQVTPTLNPNPKNTHPHPHPHPHPRPHPRPHPHPLRGLLCRAARGRPSLHRRCDGQVQ